MITAVFVKCLQDASDIRYYLDGFGERQLVTDFI